MAGEISPDIVFCKNNKKTCTEHSGWVRMDENGCVWMHLYGGKAKTREKEEQMDEQDVFLNARQRPKTRTKSASVVADDQRDLVYK